MNGVAHFFSVSMIYLLAGSLLFGCAHHGKIGFSSNHQMVAPDLYADHLLSLLSNKDYNKALLLQNQCENQSDQAVNCLEIEYNGILLTRNSILEDATKESAATKRQAQLLSKKQRWLEAETLLLDLREKMPPYFRSDIDFLIQEINKTRIEVLFREALEAKIQYGQWLSQKGQYYELELNSRDLLGSIYYRVRLNWVILQQNRLAKRLLDQAHLLVENSEYLVANRIYGTLSKFQLNPSLEERYISLGYQILERVELIVAEFNGDQSTSYSKSQINSTKRQAQASELQGAPTQADLQSSIAGRLKADAMIVDISQMIKEGRLIEINSLLGRLEKEPLSGTQLKEMKSAQRYLREQVNMLDSHADRLYSRGDISKAHSIWALLRQLDRKNDAFRAKYKRSGRVLGNMQELRQEGFYSQDASKQSAIEN